MAKKKNASARAPAPARTPPAKSQVMKKHVSSSSSEDEEEYEEVEEAEEIEEEGSEGEEEEEEEDDEVEEEEESDDKESESDEEDENEDAKRDRLRKLLEPFGKDQIIEFLKEAALKDPSIVARITQLAESDPVHRRIFVHGLGWDATGDQVHSVFRQYGEIEDCKVVTDKVTGKAKGYAFVLFKTRAGARKALKQPQRKIGNRMTSCQLASAGPVPSNPVQDSTGRKIYVANVGPDVNSYKLLSFFSVFGEIEEGPLGRDPVTGKFKGFAIFVYKTAEGCRKALEEPIKLFDGRQLQCRRAVEGQRPNKSQGGPLGTAVGAAASIQQSDISTINNYGLGVNPALLPHGVNPAAVLVGPHAGIGLANPMLAQALSQTALAPAAVGLTPSIGVTPPLALSGNHGINSISPSVIGNYGSQAALQGLGAYQSAQLGHSSAAATTMAASRPPSGFGSSATSFPSYFRR